MLLPQTISTTNAETTEGGLTVEDQEVWALQRSGNEAIVSDSEAEGVERLSMPATSEPAPSTNSAFVVPVSTKAGINCDVS